MALDLFTGFNKLPHLQAAARNRVLDGATRDFTEDEIQQRIDGYLSDRLNQVERRLMTQTWSSDNLLLSPIEADNLRDKKFLVETLARTVEDLGVRVERSRRTYTQDLSTARDRIRSVGLTSLLSTLVIKDRLNSAQGWLYGYADLAVLDPSFSHFQDPRSARKFFPSEYADFSLGIMTPSLLADTKVPVREVEVDYFFTSIPSVAGKMELGDPQSVIEPGKTFVARYFIPLYDRTNIPLFVPNPSLSMVFKLSAAVPVSSMKLKIKTYGLSVPVLHYRDSSGTWQSLPYETLDISGLTDHALVFDEVITDAIRCTFTTYSTAQNTQINKSNLLNVQLNKQLRNSGWTALLPEETEDFSGQVFEWHLSDVEFSNKVTMLRSYAVTKPLQINGKVKRLYSNITANNTGVSSDADHNGLGAEVYNHVRLVNSEGQVVVDEVLPIPAASAQGHKETLVLRGNVGMFTFFPQLHLSETKLRQEADISDHTVILPSVLQGDTELTIGLDYEVTVNGGKTWLSAWPSTDYYGKTSVAGMAGIRLIADPNNNDYGVVYHLARTQWLSSTKNFFLRGTRVLSNKNLRKQSLTGWVRGIVISRNSVSYGETHVSSFVHGVKYVR